VADLKYLSDINLGYLACAVCILTSATIDQAFDKLSPDTDTDKKNLRCMEYEDAYNLRVRDNLTWPQIGWILNISAGMAYRYANKFKNIPKLKNMYKTCDICGEEVCIVQFQMHLDSDHLLGIKI
jgi:hypothetical protein